MLPLLQPTGAPSMSERPDTRRFRGSMPALVTPFTKDGALDEAALERLCDWQIAEGSHGLVPVGTTGESPTLTHEEHGRVVEIAVRVADGRVPVIAGCGSNNTKEAVDLARHAERTGADACLVVTPYYNKPSQRGLVAHFEAVADATALPVFIYNIPGRSIVDMLPETMGRLARSRANIAGVKDATAKMDRVSAQRAACGHDFVQLSGEDATALGFNAHGGTGCISVTANVAPRLCAEFQTASVAGDTARALHLQDQLYPLHHALFLEPNPGGAKFALSLLGRCENVQRSPLVPIAPETEDAVRDAMRHAELID